MSFSSEVKQEIASLPPDKPCCMLSELNALTQFCGTLALSGGGHMRLMYRTENATVAKRIFILLKKRLSINAKPHFASFTRFGGRRVYTVAADESDTHRLMIALHMLHAGEDGGTFHGVPRQALSRNCCRRAFIRGAFLASGTLTTPEKDYHLEFAASSSARAESLQRILQKCGVCCKTGIRRNAITVYIKSSEQIAKILSLSGATGAMMRMENILAQRNLRETVRRATNCDLGNTQRQLDAAQRQLAAISSYALKFSLSGLPDSLESLARLRIANPDASLEQLGQMLDPPLGKSGVNHRMRSLMKAIAT